MRHRHRWLLVSISLLAPLSAGPSAAKEEADLEFEQVVWVQNKDPQISLLYVLVPEPYKDNAGLDKMVLRYVPAALREAERLTGPDELKRARFKGTFNVVFVVRRQKDDKHASATGFSVEQLKEYTSVPREKALKTIGRHAWTSQKLPLINPGP